MRPPGGLTTDMFNYACDIDIYNAWASIIAGKGFPTRITLASIIAVISAASSIVPTLIAGGDLPRL